MGIAFASPGLAPYDKSPEWIEWSDIYPNHSPASIENGSVQPIQLQLFPNPASSTLYVVAGVENTDQLFVFNLAGRQLDVPFSQTANEQFTADISNLGSGLYLLLNRSAYINESVSFLILR